MDLQEIGWEGFGMDCCSSGYGRVTGCCEHSNYRVADKSVARPTSRCILFDGENISFDASLVLYV
jgi:hypothetical protein